MRRTERDSVNFRELYFTIAHRDRVHCTPRSRSGEMKRSCGQKESILKTRLIIEEKKQKKKKIFYGSDPDGHAIP